MDLNWSDDRMKVAQKIVMERFAQNCVAGHLAPLSTVDDTETTVRRNRFDFAQTIVIDREVLNLHEPFSFCRFTKAQVDGFGTTQDADVSQTKVVTTLTRAASNLARWHDILFFRGVVEEMPMPPSVQMPPVANPPQSLRQAAQEAEGQMQSQPVPVNAPLNQGLVAAVYAAVLQLESQGYFNAYHLVLGATLWRELHRPTAGSMVLPRAQIEPTLMGGRFYRTTTLPENEALLVSLDGPTIDCVIAGNPKQHPRFEWLRVEAAENNEQLYLFRVRERFAPRVRENRAIVRLVAPPDQVQLPQVQPVQEQPVQE